MNRNNSVMFHVCVALDRSIKANRDKYSGILRYATTVGNWEIRSLNPYAESFGKRCEDLFASWIPDGMIGNSYLKGAIRSLRGIHPEARPRIAMIDGGRTPLANTHAEICVDNVAIARAAAERLLKCGYKSFAYVGAHVGKEFGNSEERRKAFVEFFRDRGACVKSFMPETEENRDNDDIGPLSDWLQELEKPCGVMAYYDETAQLVFDACRLAHVRIPEEVALIGVDNDLDICENMEPTLTSIMPDFEGAGFLAAKMLDKAMRDRRRKTMSCAKYGVKSLVERMSTQDTFKHGRLVSMACEFIRLHSHEGICVRDVVKEVQTSPRILELRFKQILKHSIRDEILLVRIENLKNKLRLTNRPMGELAYQCGFLSQSNAPMLFKKHVGMTMTEYRASCRG